MKNINPSLFGCGGIIVLLGLILLVLFRDRIGANFFLIGLIGMGAIVLFWLLAYLSKYLRK